MTLMGSALAVVVAFAAGLGRLSRFMAVRAFARLYRILPRHFHFRAALLGLFRIAVRRHNADAAAGGRPRARPQCRCLWSGGRAGRGKGDRPRAARGCIALNLTAVPGDAPHRPAQALPLMAATLATTHRALEGNGGRVADLAQRHDGFRPGGPRQTGSTLIPFATILLLYFVMAG